MTFELQYQIMQASGKSVNHQLMLQPQYLACLSIDTVGTMLLMHHMADGMQ